MLNSQFKILLLSAVLVSFNQADKALFEDCSQKLLPLLEQCHEKANTLGIDCDFLDALAQQIKETTETEMISSQSALQELITDISQTLCKMPTVHEVVIIPITHNIIRMLNILTYATTRSARIIHTPDDPDMAEYQRIFTIVADIAQQFIDLPFMTEYKENKGIRCIIANLIWQFGELRPASKKLIKNSQG